MHEIEELLDLTRKTAHSACQLLCESRQGHIRSYSYMEALPREMKAAADKALEELILSRLKPVGLPILSEEFGELEGNDESGLKFIVDPLDGTVNFVRGLGPASVSIALYLDNKPVFGVLGLYPSGDIACGGKDIGAFLNDVPIEVSTISNPVQGVLCTGIPSRFEFTEKESSLFVETISSFGKVRMLGAASISLLQVAMGTAEVYTERDIMLWDVAAGLAIVEGAGGVVSVEDGQSPDALNVVASNGAIDIRR